MFKNRKANMGLSIFLLVILFNIIMYIVVWGANQDPNFDIDATTSLSIEDNDYSGINGSTTSDISMTSASSWTDGFKVSILGLPNWFNLFYGLFQAILILGSGYAMIRGLG